MQINFLLPGTTRSWHSGGLIVSLKLARYLSEIVPVQIVTYKDREAEHPFFTDDFLAAAPVESTLWLVTFGPHTTNLLQRLRGRRAAYYAQSAGWSIDMPSGVPILCVSKFVMAYWTQWAPNAPVFLLSPTLDPACRNTGATRDIDVLYLSRKTSPYLHHELVPRLRERCRVETIDQLIPHEQLLRLFNRTKVYVYDWTPTADRAWVDGFALQPLEAMVCGCTPFVAISGGPIDYLDNGVSSGQITGSTERDTAAILRAIEEHRGSNPDEVMLRERYSESALRMRLRILVQRLEALRDLRVGGEPIAIALPAAGQDASAWRDIVARQQQEIAILKDQVHYHDNAVSIHREGIDFLRSELAERDRAIAVRDEGIEWLRAELAKNAPPQPAAAHAAAATAATPAASAPPRSAVYRRYARALKWYRRSNNTMARSAFENLIRFVTIVIARAKGIRFPSRAIGGWWSIWRWRLEFLMHWNELPSVEACRTLIRPGMTVIDVGAHIGYYTRLFSELVGRSGRVLAFEAEPENFELLRTHVRRKGYRNVQPFPYAVADRAGTLTLHLSPGHTNHSLVDGLTESTDARDVEAISLDSFLARQNIASVDFVKIDVEGAELRVLAGMRDTIARSPRLAMLIELNPAALRIGGHSAEELVAALRNAGFRLRASNINDDGPWGDVPPPGSDETVNLLCTR